MIAEKSQTAQKIIDSISASAQKVNFISGNEVEEAFTYLENKGIPNAKHEEYKYCNFDGILKKEFKNFYQKFTEVAASEIKKYKLNEAINLVVLNGNYNEALSDKIIVKGITIKNLQNFSGNNLTPIASIAKSNTDAFVAFSNAFSGNGIYLEVENANVIPMPVQIIYVNCALEDSWVSPRSFVHLQKNAELTLTERFVNIGKAKVFSNFLSEKLIEENAKLISYTIQQEGSLTYSVNTNQVHLKSNSVYDNTTITLSGQVVRNNHHAVLIGENSVAHLNGLFFTGGTQLVDNHTLMDHQVPNCESNELYKGVVNDKSTGVFNGKIFVRKDAQKTNAFQSSKNILLSDDGAINAKPQLEIYANDVKCSHGTSTGKIDDAALFYLKARGIGDASAKKLLLRAFANEVIDKIEIESLKEEIETELNTSF